MKLHDDCTLQKLASRQRKKHDSFYSDNVIVSKSGFVIVLHSTKERDLLPFNLFQFSNLLTI